MRRHAIALVWLCAANPVFAGTEITVETRRADAAPEAKAQQSLIAVEGRKIHAEAGDGRHGLVYRGEEGVLQILDHAEKSVLTVDRATARSMSQRMDGAREAVRRLPEPQRRAVERLLGPEQEPGAVELRASGRSERVNGVSCRLLEVMRDGVRLAEICEAKQGSAGVPPEALAPMRELAAFAAEVGALLPPSLGADGLVALALVERVEGVPLRVRAWPKDGPATESRIVRAVPKHFAAERFQPPSGYTGGLDVRVRE